MKTIQSFPTRPVRESFLLENAKHEPLGILIPHEYKEVALEAIRKAAAHKLCKLIDEISERAGLTDEEAEKLVTQDD